MAAVGEDGKNSSIEAANSEVFLNSVNLNSF